ncbi:MAG: hypothetical protein M1819_004216 [Sarea resinae]|nr:MAG: hypothetical protein M1819_004216 [Sarea resinae]
MAPSRAYKEASDSTLHLPRILCLHGGGTNAEIFRIQCRALIAQLKPHFRLCFANAPFVSPPHPAMIPIFQDHGPFRCWLRWSLQQPELDATTVFDDIQRSLQTAMAEDDCHGATGEWVALLGFSQGAKVAASLLFRQQLRAERLGKQNAGSNYGFAVLLAGRAPLISFDPDLVVSSAMPDASQITTNLSYPESSFRTHDQVLRLPTVHVHGLRDPGIELHRCLLEEYCEEGSTRIVEWDGEHRLPIKSKDVVAVVDQIVDVARQTGVLTDLDGRRVT